MVQSTNLNIHPETLNAKTFDQEEEIRRAKPPDALAYSLRDPVVRGVPLTPLLPSLRVEGAPSPAFEAVSPGLSLAAALDAAFGIARDRVCGALGRHLSVVMTLSNGSTCTIKEAVRAIHSIAENMQAARLLPVVSSELETVSVAKLDQALGTLYAEMQEATAAKNFKRITALAARLDSFTEDVDLAKQLKRELDKCNSPVLALRSALGSCRENLRRLSTEAPGVRDAVAALQVCLAEDMSPALQAIRRLVERDQRLRGWEEGLEVLGLVETSSARVAEGINDVIKQAHKLMEAAATVEASGGGTLATFEEALDQVQEVLGKQVPHRLQEAARAWSQLGLESAAQAVPCSWETLHGHAETLQKAYTALVAVLKSQGLDQLRCLVLSKPGEPHLRGSPSALLVLSSTASWREMFLCSHKVLGPLF